MEISNLKVKFDLLKLYEDFQNLQYKYQSSQYIFITYIRFYEHSSPLKLSSKAKNLKFICHFHL